MTKKPLILTVTVVCIFVLMAIGVYASSPPTEIDIESLADEKGTGNVHIFAQAQYTDFVLQMGNIGDYHSLGEIDLSKYDTVTIWYGADGGAQYYDDNINAFLALTTTGATQDTKYVPIEDVNIISKVNLENPEGSWANSSMEVSMKIDSDFNGEVFLALNMAKIGDRQDGLAITEIEFSDSTYATPTPEPTKEPTPSPVKTNTPVPSQKPSTEKPVDVEKSGSNLPVIIGLSVAVVAVVVVVVVLIKKKKK